MADWISDFVASTSHLTSPEIFRVWGAITALSGAMERKVWVRTKGSNLYPNLYVVLVANPGIGKTEITHRIQTYWKDVPDLHVAHSSITKAALVDSLNEGLRSVVRPNEVPAVSIFNSLLVAANELGVLLPTYDYEFMNVLTDLYDCKNYSEKRRTNKLVIEIDNPHMTILAACTPAYLMSVLPEGAWDQGFLSRTLLIYSGDMVLNSLFLEESEDQESRKELTERLKEISKFYGKLSFTLDAKEALDTFYLSGGDPKPDHPKLFHYNTRRIVHILKLSMIASLSESLEGTITLDHVQRALDWLMQAEFYMPDIFKAMSSGGPGQLIEECWHFVFSAYSKSGKSPVPEARVINFLGQRTPAHNVQQVLTVMQSAGLLRRQLTEKGNAYVPGTKDK